MIRALSNFNRQTGNKPVEISKRRLEISIEMDLVEIGLMEFNGLNPK